MFMVVLKFIAEYLENKQERKKNGHKSNTWR